MRASILHGTRSLKVVGVVLLALILLPAPAGAGSLEIVGYSGYLGSAVAYTTSYIKELSIEDGIRNHQYLDRLSAMYHEHGVEPERKLPAPDSGRRSSLFKSCSTLKPLIAPSWPVSVAVPSSDCAPQRPRLCQAMLRASLRGLKPCAALSVQP